MLQPDYLKIDYSSHPREKPNKCEVCSKMFALRSSLIRHQQLHLGAKTHVCKICGKTFSRKFSLENPRRRIYLGELPYKCEFWGRIFRVEEFDYEPCKSPICSFQPASTVSSNIEKLGSTLSD
ncbi:hypothetical protein TNCT_636611 [Trichonephila clavata]|uniref:C2H2-type domain-containing protein n=1 Tax=Trichonephila clavata TaxID=2740835 RepID=A0A8X6FF99_TRICU|nr:hypothetical protein TNCT_636611 [Trichonephila clavata]